MMAKSNKEPQRFGILGLPPNWSVAVQLIGTFGLAVFLVLWYVFRMHPAEVKRYDKFNTSITELTEKVDNLAEAVKGNQMVLKEYQSGQLEKLFTKCVAYKIADLIILYRVIPSEVFDIMEIQKKLENTLIIDTELAEGLLYADGSDIAGMFKDKILKSKIAEDIAKYIKHARKAGPEWVIANREYLSDIFIGDISRVIRRENF